MNPQPEFLYCVGCEKKYPSSHFIRDIRGIFCCQYFFEYQKKILKDRYNEKYNLGMNKNE